MAWRSRFFGWIPWTGNKRVDEDGEPIDPVKTDEDLPEAAPLAPQVAERDDQEAEREVSPP